MKTFMRLCAFLLALTMCLSLFSGNVWAAEEGFYTDGSASISEEETIQPTIKLNKSSLTLEVKKTAALRATVEGPDQSVTWKSDNTQVATVDKNGKVTAKKAGTCTITAAANGVSAKCKVKVQSEKESAIAAYKKFLSQEEISWLNDSDLSKPSNEYSFCLAYLDNNDIPELIMTQNDGYHWSDHVALYAYVNGKVKLVTSEMLAEKNYKKKGIYLDCCQGNGGYWYTNYYLFSNGKATRWLYYEHTMDWNSQREYNNYYKYKSKKKIKIKKSEFKKILKKKVGSAKAKAFSMHKNTKANRAKYLK